MPPLVDHEAAHRAALRVVAQERAHSERVEGMLLHVLGRALAIVQEIQFELEGIRRERRSQQAGHEITTLLTMGNHD